MSVYVKANTKYQWWCRYSIYSIFRGVLPERAVHGMGASENWEWPWVPVDTMTCTGIDAETAQICMKIEQISKKYDVPVMDVMNRVMQMHITWEEQ